MESLLQSDIKSKNGESKQELDTGQQQITSVWQVDMDIIPRGQSIPPISSP